MEKVDAGARSLQNSMRKVYQYVLSVISAYQPDLEKEKISLSKGHIHIHEMNGKAHPNAFSVNMQ